MPQHRLRNRYPGFSRLVEDGGILATIDGTVIPVVIVDNLQGQLSSAPSLPTPGGLASSSGGVNPLATVAVISPSGLVTPQAGFGQGFPLIFGFPASGSSQNFANNTGTHTIAITLAGAQALLLEEVYITFDTLGAPSGSSSGIISFNIAPMRGVANGSDNWNSPNQWSRGRSSAAAANTTYYCLLERSRFASTGEATRGLNQTGAARTLWFDGSLPQIPIFGGGSFGLSLITAVAAGGDVNTVSFQVLARAFF